MFTSVYPLTVRPARDSFGVTPARPLGRPSLTASAGLTRESSAATLGPMRSPQPTREPSTPTAPPVADASPDEPSVPSTDASAASQTDPATAAALRALDTLPIAGFTRRRVAIAVAALVTAWVVIVFARQVSEGADAASRAEQAAADNRGLQTQVTALQHELALVERPAFVQQQARAYGLGTDKEVPFGLGPDAPPISEDAPGSAAQALGSEQEHRTPLDTWLSLLFGPGD
jgi:cell division protein FtsB